MQNIVINILNSVHPSIEHNLAKIETLKRAFFHCKIEKIQGGYFEFGMYEGTSFLAAIKISQKLDGNRNFYGFDSFEGMRYFNDADRHPFFKEGEFASSYEKVSKRFRQYRNARIYKGYFEESIKNQDARKLCGENKAAVVFIDCDLSTPAKIALDFVGPILQPGTVIILDDYWAYKGNPSKGVAGAFNQFLKENPKIEAREYYRYGYGGNSFLVSRV